MKVFKLLLNHAEYEEASNQIMSSLDTACQNLCKKLQEHQHWTLIKPVRTEKHVD